MFLEKCWTRPATSGPSPEARCAHTAVCSGKIFIFGGWDGRQMMHDLYIFYPETMTWSIPITTGKPPSPRAGHTCVAVGTKLYFFGGGDGSGYLNDLHILQTETMEWSQAFVAGTSPAARSRHTCTLVGKNKLFVIGGGDESRVYNDVFLLDTDTNTWSRPDMHGDLPCARWGHTVEAVGSRLILFGGHDGTTMLNDLYVLNTETMTWSAPMPGGVVPSPRAGHSISKCMGNLILFGGGDGRRIFKDLYFLNPETFVFSQPVVNGAAPAVRCAHSSTMWDDKLIVFGGGDGNRRYKDVYVLSVTLVLQYQSEALQKMKKKNPRRLRAPSINAANDVSAVLARIGLQKYTESFLQQEITVDMFPLLTEDHLVQLGFTTIGARLQFTSYVQSTMSPTVSPSEGPPSNGHAAASHGNTSPACQPNGTRASRDPTELVATTQHLAALTSEIASLRTCLHLLTDTVKELARSSQANASVVSITSPSQASPAPSSVRLSPSGAM